MTINAETDLSGPYYPNGSTTVFPFGFKAPGATEIAVYSVDSLGEATLVSSGYTVTFNGNQESSPGGSVTFASAPAAGPALYILLDPDFTQNVGFERGSAWSPEPVNEALDRSAQRDLALRRDLRRSFSVPIGETVPALPSAAGRASKFLAFDGSGNPIASSGTGADAGLRADLAAPGGAELLFGQPIILGARGGGLPDTANIAQALADAVAENRSLVFKEGDLFLINDNISFEPYIDDNAHPAQRNRRIVGYGARVKASGSGAQRLLRIGAGYTPWATIIEGLTFDARGNTDLLMGLLLENTTHVHVKHCAFLFGNGHADYDALRLQQRISDNIDTGCFWTVIRDNMFRTLSGTDTRPRSAIHARGTSNATHILSNTFTGSKAGVLATTQDAVVKVLPNGMKIFDNDFEGLTEWCVDVRGLAGGAGITGLIFDQNRIEQATGTGILSMTGATVEASTVPYWGPNYIGAVGGSFTLIHNPENLPISIWDASNSFPTHNPDIYAAGGMTVRSQTGHAYASRPATGGGGFGLYGANGLLYGDWKAVGGDSVLGGIDEGRMIQGVNMTVSSSGVRVRQIQRVMTWAGETSKTWVFPYFAEADNSYSVNIMLRDAYTGNEPYFSSPTTTQVTINMPGGFTGVMLLKLER
jgi:hypothetical protein